jgi:glycine oxidase
MSFPEPRLSSGPRIIVVGAGAVGLFAAISLLERGASVTVVEGDARAGRAGLVPRSASAAAAGMLGPYSEGLYEGPTAHRLLSKLCVAGLNAWDERLAQSPQFDVLVRETGALLLAHGDADMARVLRVRDRARNAGANFEWTDGLPDDLDPHLYSLRVKGALRLKDERVVAVGPMLEALADMVADLGGSVLRERSVSHLAVRNGRAMGVALTDGSGLVSDGVVLATGALAPPALVAAAPALQRLTPAKGILGVVQPEASAAIQETVRTMGCYAVPGELGEIYFGSSMDMGRTDLDHDEEVLQRLFTALRAALPGARFESRPRFHSVGLRPMSPDWAPMVGPSGPEGCFVACGHSRNGWLLGPLTGAMIAAQVFGGPVEDLWTAFTPDRFEKKAA